MAQYTKEQILEDADLMIGACGSAQAMFDVAVELRYQIRARPTEKLTDLKAAYNTIKNYIIWWSGANEDSLDYLDELIDQQVNL